MAYTRTNYRTKKQLREAVKRSLDQRDEHTLVGVYQPGPFGAEVPNGPAVIEGPQYPEPHRWYARVIVKDGVIVKFVG